MELPSLSVTKRKLLRTLMTRSLPGRPGSGSAARWADQLQSTVFSVGMKVTPKLPIGVQRLLTGGRSMTIDGNTLDPTLRLALAGQRALGINGLVVADDAVASRAQLLELTAGLGGTDINGCEVHDISLPGPAGDMAARHYRPVGGPEGGAHPVLVFYHGGGFVVGDLDTHDAICRLTCRDAQVVVLSVDYRLAPSIRHRPHSTTRTPRSGGPMTTRRSWAGLPGVWPSAGTAPVATWPPG